MAPAPKTPWVVGARGSAFGAMLRTAGAWTLCAGASASVILGVLRGAAALLSCATGVLVVAALFASGMWALQLVLRGAPHLAQAGAFAVFFLQMYVGLMLVAAGRSAAWIDASALAAGAIGATLVWQAGLVTGFATARRPVFDEAVRAADDAALSDARNGGRA